VAAVNRGLAALGLPKHPNKTFIGRTDKGFDLLGDHFGPQSLTVAKLTVTRFVECATREEKERVGGQLAGGGSRWGREKVTPFFLRPRYGA
jgi:RNA-directed DNA polymerase